MENRQAMFCPRCGIPSHIPNRCVKCNYYGLMVTTKNVNEGVQNKEDAESKES